MLPIKVTEWLPTMFFVLFSRNKKDLDESRPSQAVLPSEASIESPSEEEYEVEEGERI